MAGPLTPELYEKLVQRFGSVLIANAQEEMVFRNRGSLLSSRDVRCSTVQAVTKADIAHYGEYYRVCCPKCNDTRYRLWINHRAVEFPWLIVCYNENCYDSIQARDQLIFFLFKTRRPKKPVVHRGKRDTATLKLVEPPGKLTRLDNLPRTHHANEYLADERGYDPWELGRLYGVSYCEYSERYPQCNNKIIIPVVMNGKMVGWQARFIGERNWKASALPKYWDMPGMPKRLMLYNHDLASLCPWVCLVEGVTDVWSSGTYSMALLGSTITFAQRRILAYSPFKLKPIVLMLDGDAYLENEAITEELRREHPAPVVQVNLPPDVDPGGLTPEANLDLIYQAAREQGVVLPSVKKG